jgi:protocatechuate 3,4-dioxygenase alpha subunit
MQQDERRVLADDSQKERVRIEGRVLDGDEAPVDDALVELWQADASGNYGSDDFLGFGRAATDADGRFWFETVKPGPVGGGAPAAPHMNLHVFARGLLDRLSTRIYFPDESANQEDAVLGSVDEGRRSTLIAHLETDGGMPVYGFDIHLQGAAETVFFDA